MKLWIVTRGEFGEGKSPRSLHLSRETAIEAACKLANHWHGNGGVRPDDFKRTSQDGAMTERWSHTSGCDVTSVESIEVQP